MTGYDSASITYVRVDAYTTGMASKEKMAKVLEYLQSDECNS
jgi:hypothetical protein